MHKHIIRKTILLEKLTSLEAFGSADSCRFNIIMFDSINAM